MTVSSLLLIDSDGLKSVALDSFAFASSATFELSDRKEKEDLKLEE
jgi:hypothetical protein